MSTALVLAADVSRFTSGTVTTAGFALGLALLGTEHWRWYKTGGGGAAAGAAGGGGRDPKQLVPYWFGIVCGILMVACPAGVLGSVAGFLRWGANGVGGMAMSWLTGKDGTTLANASAPGLDSYGAVVITALTAALWWLRKSIAKAVKGKWKKGVLTGCVLCISTGTAAVIAQTVVGGANDLGALVLGQIATGTFV
ncbi:hypothetical protein L0F81_02950 [Streptomyces tricolor]|uniref:Uncharacterized protein n=1 Tax=Streptomyces tricolor TaxID=68277 RepID=A0ABS9J9M1_9ACTN|nr:hypothetical protein [Streptomyces tricolor]MCG0062255.1 hypothetical protein [Streptomyces tricolor]